MGFSQIFHRRTELGLLVLSALFVSAMLINLELSQGNTLTSELVWVIGGFVVIFLAAHCVLCFVAPHADQIMLPVTATLNGLGLVMIYRIDEANGTSLVTRQVQWTFVGVVLLVLVLVFLREYRSLSRYSYLLGLVGLALLALPLVWPQPADAEARIWITFGPFSLQPGEFSKILLLLFFAQLLVNKRALFTVAGYRVLGLSFPRLRDLAPILAVWAIAILIMAGTNDFGPALLLFATVLGMLYLATGRVSWLFIGVVLVALGGTGVYMISAKIQDRVSNFLDPFSTYDSSGFQLANSLFGMSWGGLTGTGIGQGHPDIIPVVWTDFILAAVGEEMGLVGLSGVLVLFALLVTRGFRTALLARDSYGKLVASGLSLTIAIQVFVVVAGISALMPMTGLTTPFMSAGGSSLMANYMLLGILLRISDAARRPAAAPADSTDGSSGLSPVGGAEGRTPEGGEGTGYMPAVGKVN
ncbi:FtsW/RodA/SpoVE family cell cycle protein [Corynebacterium mastitidis]|uniref:Cell division protein FtsW n=1 Tax=Corynebacterium mastitidis TaxID=161890 RepID=A0A2N0X8I5_9CORY|nr:FtsW/RodA/SpoVE family cell cycle protein [Corynebacterium mastitidis]MCH6197028.1 FtsW/RodA/SpoVE family cell cycle protein [Corynebacterium mastitidis]PKF69022.1 cell division protein FtsW [Corynebacterium mastitidis]